MQTPCSTGPTSRPSAERRRIASTPCARDSPRGAGGRAEYAPPAGRIGSMFLQKSGQRQVMGPDAKTFCMSMITSQVSPFVISSLSVLLILLADVLGARARRIYSLGRGTAGDAPRHRIGRFQGQSRPAAAARR